METVHIIIWLSKIMFLPVGSTVLWISFLPIILQVIFYPRINCYPFKSDSSPVIEILKVPSDASFNDDIVEFRYSLKHDKSASNKKLSLPERARDDDIQMEYNYKCPKAKAEPQEDRSLAQLVAVIYRKLDTSDKERRVSFYLPGPATVPVFEEPEECTTEAPVKTTYVYKGCGGE